MTLASSMVQPPRPLCLWLGTLVFVVGVGSLLKHPLLPRGSASPATWGPVSRRRVLKVGVVVLSLPGPHVPQMIAAALP